MKRLAAVAGVLFSALLVSQVVADLRACKDAWGAWRGDSATTLRECRPVAEQGDLGAQFILGIMYEYGLGVPRDHREAARWYRGPAEQGVVVAQVTLGLWYAEGRGVPQDHAEGMKWLRRAAEQGDALAQRKLGALYFLREGVPQDDLLAYFWFNLAASRADTTDREDLVKMRDFVVKRLTPEQRAKAQEMARDWKPKPERPAEPTPGK